MDRACYVCKQHASKTCAKCGQPICRAHEQMGLNERRTLESLCPFCAGHQHQERLQRRQR